MAAKTTAKSYVAPSCSPVRFSFSMTIITWNCAAQMNLNNEVPNSQFIFRLFYNKYLMNFQDCVQLHIFCGLDAQKVNILSYVINILS